MNSTTTMDVGAAPGTGGVHSTNNLAGGGGSSGKFSGEHDSECSSVTSDSIAGGLFLKCKHTGSGSGGGGVTVIGGVGVTSGSIPNNQQQCPFNVKKIIAELQERKEDFEKLKERIGRLEVSSHKKKFISE